MHTVWHHPQLRCHGHECQRLPGLRHVCCRLRACRQWPDVHSVQRCQLCQLRRQHLHLQRLRRRICSHGRRMRGGEQSRVAVALCGRQAGPACFWPTADILSQPLLLHPFRTVSRCRPLRDRKCKPVLGLHSMPAWLHAQCRQEGLLPVCPGGQLRCHGHECQRLPGLRHVCCRLRACRQWPDVHSVQRCQLCQLRRQHLHLQRLRRRICSHGRRMRGGEQSRVAVALCGRQAGPACFWPTADILSQPLLLHPFRTVSRCRPLRDRKCKPVLGLHSMPAWLHAQCRQEGLLPVCPGGQLR